MSKVKVRVAVAVDPSGDWNACGWSGASSDEDILGIARDTVGQGERIYWLTAELDIPAQETVECTVTAAP